MLVISVRTAFLAKHARIVIQRFQFADDDLLIVAMGRINQIIILAGSENRWHQQQAMRSSFRELIPEPS